LARVSKKGLTTQGVLLYLGKPKSYTDKEHQFMTTGELFKQRGPYLSAAFLCEKVLEEKDGVKSAIRIIDRIIHTVVHPFPPEKMEPFDYPVCLYILLKSGDARGPMTLRVTLVKPSGESPPPLEQTVVFEGEEDRGVDIIGNLTINFDQPGIYWFDVELGGIQLTRIPLRVVYVPQPRRIHGPGGYPPQA
jgi:hypothetical protein